MRKYDDIDSLPLPEEDQEPDMKPEELRFINRLLGPEVSKVLPASFLDNKMKMVLLGVFLLLLFLPVWDDLFDKMTHGNKTYNILLRIVLFVMVAALVMHF